MMTTSRPWAVFAVLLISSSSSAAPPLEELLERAMRSNSEIAVARAEVELAKAQLNLTQMKVARETVSLHGRLTAQTREIQLIRAQLKDTSDGKDATAALIDAEAELAEIQSQLSFLTGQSASGQTTSFRPTAFHAALTAARPLLQTPLGQKIRTVLGQTVPVEFVETPLGDVGTYLSELCEIPIVVDQSIRDLPVSLTLGDAPFAAVTQSIEDGCPQIRFVIREYGILITSAEVAERRQLVSVVDFWNLSTGLTEEARPETVPGPKNEKPSKEGR